MNYNNKWKWEKASQKSISVGMINEDKKEKNCRKVLKKHVHSGKKIKFKKKTNKMW